jgi:hypothetical protein
MLICVPTAAKSQNEDSFDCCTSVQYLNYGNR